MKRMLLFLILISLSFYNNLAFAQIISVTSETDFNVVAGTTSFANGATSARLQFFYTGGTPVQSTCTITDTDIGNVRRVRAIRIF